MLMGRYGFEVGAPQTGVNGNDMGSPNGKPWNTDRHNQPSKDRRSVTMRIKLSYMTPLLGTAAAAVAISAAPIAAAADSAPQQDCGPTGSGTVCQWPGNVEINDAPPPVSFYPYGGDAFLLGGGGFRGGGHR
ncbi:MAG: hypothetical protein QOI25_843 [Mycobacterium sp.]|nr:hypothetical protein [Mycobacterium sp.]